MQKFTVSIVLKNKGKTNSPIYLRVYVNGKVTLKSTGHSIEPKYWNEYKELVKSSHRIASHIDADLTLKKDQLQKTLIEQQVIGKQISVDSVRNSLKPGESMNLFKYVEKWILRVRHNRSEGTLKNYTKHLKKLEEFHGSKNLALSDITPAYLSSYQNHLRESVGGNYTHG